MNDWCFDNNEYWWDMDFRALKFSGECNGDRYVFSISQIALNDYFETDDTREMAIENYLNNHKLVEDVALRFTESHVANENIPHYFITREDFFLYAGN